MWRAVGIAVFSGMLGVTLFGIFLTPVSYVLLRSNRARRIKAAEGAAMAKRDAGGLAPATEKDHA